MPKMKGTDSTKKIRVAAESAFADGIKTKAALYECLPLSFMLRERANSMISLAKTLNELADDIQQDSAKYVTEHPSVLDDDPIEDQVEVTRYQITIEDRIYKLVKGYGRPRREDGAPISQAFLKTLPKDWTKPKLEGNFVAVSDKDLASKGLIRPDTFTWSVAE